VRIQLNSNHLTHMTTYVAGFQQTTASKHRSCPVVRTVPSQVNYTYQSRAHLKRCCSCGCRPHT
jgi:hypothetical protein